VGADAAYVGDVDKAGVARLDLVGSDGACQALVPPGAALSWGYVGQGPSSTAAVILAAETGDAAVAERLRDDFARDVLSRLPVNGRFALPRAEVRDWLVAQGHHGHPVRRERRPTTEAPADTGGAPEVDRSAAELAAWARSLHERERRLTEREARVDARAVTLGMAPAVEPATALPVEPVRRQIGQLLVDSGEDIDGVARALTVEPAWVRGVVAGEVAAVDVRHVRRVCEGLRCTPYDLWGATAARSVAYAYGPDEWPAEAEPLLDSPALPSPVWDFAGPGPAVEAETAGGLVPELAPDLFP
jgi:hypothetical protein